MIDITLPEYLFIVERWEFVNQKKLINKHKNRGVYVLFGEGNRVLYVGKSRRLIARVQSHVRGNGTSSEFSRYIEKIGVIPIEKLCELDIYETHAINTLKPQFNKDKVFLTIEELRLFEFKLTIISGKVEQLRDEIECLIEEDACTLRNIDLEYAKESLKKHLYEYRKINDILDDYGR